MLRTIILPMAITLLTGCSLGGGSAPNDHFYRLPEIKFEPGSIVDKPVFEEMVIKSVKSTGLYHERAILFVESDRPLELQRYHYSFWASTPAELVHNALMQGIKSSGIASQVSQIVSINRPDFIISSRIVNFERNIQKGGASILVSLDISVRNGENDSIVLSQRYSHSKTLQTMDMHASVNAFGDALKFITLQLLNDLKTKYFVRQ